MHDYSIDKHPKEKVLFGLSFIAIVTAPALNRGIAWITHELGAATGLWSTSLITVVPMMTVFGAIYWLFNSKLWKLEWLRSRLLIPNLNGTWKCAGLSVMRQGSKVDFPWSGEIRITQSWTKISIYISTSRSSSRSTSASIVHEPGVGYRLFYHYTNAPNADQTDLKKHDGTAEILFNEDCLSGAGHYFTDQHRMTTGTMKLQKA
jgi:SMODS-associating 2TM, beta-strand rich effector domain